MKFFEEKPKLTGDQDSIVMTSFPRSGNTMLRAYLEKLLGTFTGSDSALEARLNKDLMMRGLAAEGLVDSRVMVIKTHFPERGGSV